MAKTSIKPEELDGLLSAFEANNKKTIKDREHPELIKWWENTGHDLGGFCQTVFLTELLIEQSLIDV